MKVKVKQQFFDLQPFTKVENKIEKSNSMVEFMNLLGSNANANRFPKK
jgi:hypothetical protein